MSNEVDTGNPRARHPASWRRWQDWVIVSLGVWLFVSTFVLGGNAPYDLAARVASPLIVLFALWALSRPASPVVEWGPIVLSFALVVAPSVFGYLESGPVAWNTYAVGLLIFVLAVWARDRAHRQE